MVRHCLRSLPQDDSGPLNTDPSSSGLTTVAEQLIQEFPHERGGNLVVSCYKQITYQPSSRIVSGASLTMRTGSAAISVPVHNFEDRDCVAARRVSCVWEFWIRYLSAAGTEFRFKHNDARRYR